MAGSEGERREMGGAASSLGGGGAGWIAMEAESYLVYRIHPYFLIFPYSKFKGFFIMLTVIRRCEFDAWSLEFDAFSSPLELNGRGRCMWLKCS